jgi:tetratricopeptide (TPR) repeat protein
MDTGEMSLKKLMDILKSNPRDLAAFKGLEEQYFLSHNWKQLSELYQFRADSIKRENPNEAAHLYFKSGDLHEKRLGNKEDALLAYQQAFALHPQKKEYGDILANFYMGQENWQKALDILQKQMSYFQDSSLRIAILLKMAPIWKNRVQNRPEAKKCLQQILDINKTHEEALRQLEELYYEDRQWDKLLELYQVRLSTSPDPNFRAKILERCALLCQEELQDWPKAIQFYVQVLQLIPNNLIAMRALENLYGRVEKWDYVVEMLKRQTPLVQERQEKIALLLKMANILKGNLKNFAAAAECYEQIQTLGENINILKMLEEMYAQLEDWGKLANVYEREAKLIPDKNAQADLYCKIGLLARDRMQNYDMAIRWYTAAYQIRHNLELLKIVQALLVKQNKTKELIENYYEEIEIVSDDVQKLAIYSSIANIHRDRKDLEAAAKVYEQVTQKYPQHMATIDNLKTLYLALEDYPALVNTLNKESSIVSKPAQRIPIYIKITEILKEKLGQEKDAIPYYYKALEIDANNLEIWEKLREFYARTEDYPQLIKTITSIIQLDAKRSEHGYLEVARLYRDKIGDINTSVESFKRVLATNSRNLEAIKSLAAIYQAQGEWLLYVELVAKQLELTIDMKEQIELHSNLYQAYRKLNNDREEERHLLDTMKLEYDNKAAIAGLKDLYTRQENWGKYVQIWQKESEIFTWDDATLIERYKTTAQIYVEKLNNAQSAIQYFEKARHLNNNRSDILDALEALYVQTEDDRNLVQILDAKAKLSKVGEETRKLYFRMGSIWEDKLQDKTQAILAFRKVADSDLYNMAALKKLANLYKICEDYTALADIYLREYVAASDPEQQIFLAFACGRIWEEKLHQEEKAIECYAQVVKLDAKNMETIDRLIKIYHGQQNWAELAAMYQKKIALLEQNVEIIRLCFDLATIYRDHMNAPTQAVEVYNDILSLDKANMQAIYALKELYPKLSLWEPLVAVLKTESQLMSDNEKKKSLYIQMAEICEEKLMRYLEAIQNYQWVLKLDTKHLATIRALRSLYYKVQIPTQVIWSIDRELSLIQTPAERVTLLFEKGNLYWNQLQDIKNAIASFEQILQIAPDHLKTYETLTTIYSFSKAYPELIRLWERQIQVSPVEKQKELALLCAKVWEDYLHNDDKAQSCLKDGLRLDSCFMPARRALEKIYERLAKWQELLALYQGEIVLTKESTRLAQIYYQMAKVWESELKNNAEAIKYYDKVHELEPYNIKPIHGLQNIYRMENRYAELLGAYQAEQAQPDIERERRIFLHLECAEIQRFQLDNVEAAIQSYQAVLDFQLDPNNLSAIRGSEDLYDQQNKYKELQTMLFRELELQKDKNRLIAIHLQLASLMEEKLQEVDVSIEHFSEAHLSRPTSLPILRRLKMLLKKRERWPKYAEILEKEVLLISSAYDLIPLHEELIEIYDGKLEQLEKAILHGEEALKLDAHRVSAIVRLETLYTRTEETARLVELYLQETTHLKADTARDRLIWLYAESGKLYTSLQKLPEAVACYQKVVLLDPAHKESLSSLVKLLTILKQWEELINLYTLAAQLSRNKGEVETLYLKIGELWEKEFKNEQQALLAYQIAYSMNNKNLAAVSGMRKIFEQQQHWGDAVEFLGIETSLVEEKRQPPLCLKMGEIWEEKLGMPHQALTCYLRVMGYGFHRATAERIMRIQQEVGDYEGLVDILKKDIRVTEKREELVPKLLILGNIVWRQLNNTDEAVDVYLKVFKLQPDQIEAIECLEQLLPQQSKWKELIAILGKKREILTEPDRLLDLYNKMGEIYDKELHSGNMAIKYYEFAADIAPRDLELVHKLQTLYRAWGYYKKLIALNQKEIQLVSEQERIIALYREIGEVWECRLFEEEQAMRAYEKLIELKPDDIASIRALSGLYKRHQAWDKLISVYKLLIDDTHNRQDKAEEIRIYLELGAVYRDELSDANSAIQAFSHILELEPVIEALSALEALYKSLGQARSMTELLQQKLELCNNDKDRLQLYIHLGTIYEKELDDPDHAIEAFVAALQLDPDRLDVLKEIDWLYLRKKKWEDLAQICLREFNLISEQAEKAELCYRLGIMERDRFTNSSKAKEWFLKAIECQPDLRKAIKALTGLAILAEDWTQAVKYISLEIQYIKDPQDKVAALTDLGSLYQSKLRLVQKAKEAFQVALDIDPKSTVAVEAMADILCVQNEWAQAENLLGRLILLMDKQETEKRSKIYYKWGYAAEKLGKKDEAITRYNSSLDAQNSNLDALMALGNLYFERAQWGFDKTQWQEALNIYSKINQHPAVEDKVEVMHRLAVIQEKLGVKEDAIANYRKVLRDHPEDMSIISALAKLHLDRQEHEEALKYLEMVVKSEASSFQERRKTLLTIADVQTKLHKHQVAIETSLKAFSLGVEDPEILRKLGELYMAISDWDNAQEWLEKHYTCLENVVDKVANRCLIARIQVDGRNEPDKAIKLYQESLAANPGYLPAIQGIAAILEKQEKWHELAENYRAFLDNLPNDNKMASIPIRLSLGTVYAEKLKDEVHAIDEFEKILELESDHVGAHAALANIKAKYPGSQEEAVREHLFLLQREPLRISSYRALYKISQDLAHNDRALRACRMLQLLDNVIPEEQNFLKNITPLKLQELDPEQHLLQTMVNRGGVYREIMAVTSEHMVKVYPVEMEQKYGLKRKDRLTGEAAGFPQLWQHAERLRKMMKIAELDLYVLPKKAYRIYVENTQPVSMIVGQGVLEASDVELQFLLAKHMFYVATRQTLLLCLDEAELKRYFRVTRESFVKEGTASTPEDEALLKKINWHLSRKARKILEERADIWKEMAKEEFALYGKQVELASNRCGLLVTDSLEASIYLMYRLWALQKSGKWITPGKMSLGDLCKIEPVNDLVLYHISEEYGRLRKAAKVAV